MSQRLRDQLYNSIVYAFSSLSVIILGYLLYFIFSKGLSSLSIELFTTGYWSENTMVSFNEALPGSFAEPSDLEEGAVFSTEYGFALKDGLDPKNEAIIELVYIDEQSPILKAYNIQAGHEGEPFELTENLWVEKISYVNQKDVVRSSGLIVSQTAEETIKALSTSKSLDGAFVQTKGGGIFGSLLATFYLIIISLALALPIGISTAIYLNEYASTSKFTPYIRSSIELLTGVPSIVFGLMGVLVLFPVASLFGASGTSILLGGMTLAVVLMPVIIRTTEESLKVVPQSFRDASLSLGANTSQTIFKIVLPAAIPGIMTATLLSIGRIIGESAALIYTMGTFINDDPNLLSGGTSLAVQIWSIMSGEQPNFGLASAISIIILVVVLLMNFSVKFIASKVQKTW
jgi:phosphate transport system permease protein